MSYDKRIAAYWFGYIAELRVLLYLLLRGYTPLGWRIKTPYGEIDLLLSKKNTLVIVEVKARAQHDTALASLSPQQQERLQRAATWLAARHPKCTQGGFRFDCCAVTWYMQVLHLKNAF